MNYVKIKEFKSNTPLCLTLFVHLGIYIYIYMTKKCESGQIKHNGFLSLRVFGLVSSSLLLFPQRFGQYILRPSSSVYRTREPSRNFELRPLLKPRIEGRSSKFQEGSRVSQTPEEGRWTYRPQLYGNNNKDNSPKNLNDKNQQASSQKFRQLKHSGFSSNISFFIQRRSPSDSSLN